MRVLRFLESMVEGRVYLSFISPVTLLGYLRPMPICDPNHPMLKFVPQMLSVSPCLMLLTPLNVFVIPQTTRTTRPGTALRVTVDHVGKIKTVTLEVVSNVKVKLELVLVLIPLKSGKKG